jgi:hypothetical protein
VNPFVKASAVMGVAAAAGLSAAVIAAGTPAPAPSYSTGNVLSANPRWAVEDNVLASDLRQTPAAWGNLALSNPDNTLGVTHYGYDTSNDGPLTQDPHEAFKTEPDKNVYLVMGGHNYLFQGHEGGPHGYVTRIDLDQTDLAQRVTLVSDLDDQGNPLPNFDGITWDPFSHQLLLSFEAKAPNGGIWAITLDDNGNATTGKGVRLTALGQGGYEGVQNDKAGNVWLVEDIGGAGVNGGKKPNSYVYRFVPTDKTDLTLGGTLQALQVKRTDGTPITAAQLQDDPTSSVITRLHTYGRTFDTAWVAAHTGTETFDATASAAAASATPFKRPENGVFRPGTGFKQFYFTETGDTSALSTLPGAYGGVFRIVQTSPSAMNGKLQPVMIGNEAHTGLDNIAFAGRNELLVVEDAGDSLHAQRNALDSGYLLKLSPDLSVATRIATKRWLAEGRDASALYDATTSPGYNDGDNEVTGIHVSDGDPSIAGILGAKIPLPFGGTWRVFWTQQHGENVTWEVTRAH